VELLDGEIISMSPEGNRHASTVANLNDFFGERNQRRYLIGVSHPVEADNLSEPVPDFTLLPRSQKNAKRHPFTRDTLLLVEVSDTSLSYDRDRKLRKYARTGVQEYWIVNLKQDVIEVYRTPQGEEYLDQTVAKAGDTVAPLAFPDTAMAVSEIIPPR
jgi:Uma2 family endonuclease